ncbi:MAG: conjugal transfer protein TraF [Fimbriimonadaceae bacterium]|nr:conjugal transfer protein TraF [Fimbriimonadaceae bacterium]
MNLIKKLSALVVLLPFVTISHADFQFGQGRAYGMANAGLAVPYDWIHSGRKNPAIYAFAPRGLRATFPNIGVRLQGVSFGDLNDVLGNANSGGLNRDDLANIARNFGGRPIDFGANGEFGLSFAGLIVDFRGEAIVTARPNDPLRQWVNSGGSGTIPISARMDGYGIGGYEIGFAYGTRLNTGDESGIAVGARAKFVRTYYTHQFIDGPGIAANGSATLAPEMNGNDTLSENGFGLDVGAIYSSSRQEGLFFGATIENLIKPDASFGATLPNGVPGVVGVRPYNRTFNVGAGFKTKENFIIAADWVDMFNGGDGAELRVGLEYMAGSGFALRAGYASNSGYTLGFGVFGINFAYAPDLPQPYSLSFRF